MKYKLLKDYECPTGTIRKGVVKTEEAWKGYFPFLCDGDCAIKKDWFEEYLTYEVCIDTLHFSHRESIINVTVKVDSIVEAKRIRDIINKAINE